MNKWICAQLSALLFFQIAVSSAAEQAEDFVGFATGVKVGEVTQTEAIIWARITSVETGNTLVSEGSAPGALGGVEIAYRIEDSKEDYVTVERQVVAADSDYITQISLTNLKPNNSYVFTATAYSETGKKGKTVEGKFRTPAEADSVVDVTAVVVTCQGLGSVDDKKKGHWVYSEMLKHNPDFFIHTGDVVYYDRRSVQPYSKTVDACRQRWARMFSHEWNRDFNSQVSSYFMKDDHDVLKDDCWPGQTFGELTFKKGLELFAEQTPQRELPYRKVRWGKDVEIWMLEGRDYRTKNPAPDGPEKTLLGARQKAWLKKTLKESDSTFKLVVFPSPVVGPDKKGKKDNHSNPTYATEGKELREFLAGVNNTYIVCGDRHWQYGSQDPETGIIEVCPGPINDEHTKRGGNMHEDKNYQFYFGKGKGGFLKIFVTRREGKPQITFTWHGDRDNQGKVNFEKTYVKK